MKNTSSQVVTLITLVICLTLVIASPNVQLRMGRFDTTSDVNAALYDWSGVQFTSYPFTQSSFAKLVVQDVGNVYWITLLELDVSEADNRLIRSTVVTQFALATLNQKSVQSYDVTNGVALNRTKIYQLVVQKRTEALFGIAKLIGFEFEPSRNYVPVVSGQSNQSNLQRIEFIGDSLSCGYGNEGVPPCPFAANTENALKSFPILTAEALNANYTVQCWSGKGVVRNYGDKNTTSVDPMPLFYGRTVANNATLKWNFNQYRPDAVVITLGTNDFSTAPRPSWEEYSQGYNNLLDTIQNNYPYGPDIFCFSMGSTAAYKQFTKQVVLDRKDKKIHYVEVQDSLFNPSTDSGCNGHPNTKGDIKIAGVLTEAIQQVFQ
jgi:lysophospholipase L1-like esterase